MSCPKVLVHLAPWAPCDLQGFCSGHISNTHMPHCSRLAIGGPLLPGKTVELLWRIQNLSQTLRRRIGPVWVCFQRDRGAGGDRLGYAMARWADTPSKEAEV